VYKYVVMVKEITTNAMMEIQLMEMDAIRYVQYKVDGHVSEDHLLPEANAQI
jgi:hypothetical protein